MARIVAQRVRQASVAVDGEIVGAIDHGFAVLVGIGAGDAEPDVERLADKVAVLRVFDDEHGKMNLSASDVGGSMLVISQFTLYADVRKGRRPSFVGAATPEVGDRLVRAFGARLTEHGYPVQYGRFGADMLVSLQNDGPVTIVLDSKDL